MIDPDLLWYRGRTRHQLYRAVLLTDRGDYADLTAEAIARQQMAERQLAADPDASGDRSYGWDGTIEDDRFGRIYGLEPGSCFRLADPDQFCGMVTR